MREDFALGSFLEEHRHLARHDLSASECDPLPMSDLLAMADEDDLSRWRRLDLGYSDPRGAEWLREAIAERYHGASSREILCCAGAQEALACLVGGLLGEQDHAIVIVPIYQPSEHLLRARGPTSGVKLLEGTEWRLDLNRLEAAIRPSTRLVLMNFPNSPTGAAIDPRDLFDLIALCRRHALWLVNDEVYQLADRASPGWTPPIVELYDRGVSINGLSKAFGLPGLRAGWIVCRDAAVLAAAMRGKSALSSCLAGPSEMLARIALRNAETVLGRNRQIARENQSRLRDVLTRHVDLFAPGAGSNTALSMPRYLGPEGARAFSERLVRQAGILAMPSCLWTTPLAEVPRDRIRFGLGGSGVSAGLDRLDEFLSEASARQCA